jgi:Ca-activated chloride channel family protein
MTYKKIIFATLILSVIIAAAAPSHAQSEKDADQTLSPYFLVKGHDPDVDRLPLKSTQTQVNISGVIADVTVTQVYKNEGHKPLEAVYVFPASTKAAVYGMKMTIGERIITAKIQEREQARQAYNQAKQAGQSASLLEQHRPNVFQMNVANILPSDVIQVELKYTELLVPTDTVYEFIYPTVVGPRYVDGQDPEAGFSDTWTSNPYLHQGEPPPYAFHIAVDISAGIPIQDIACESHKTRISFKGPDFASVTLDPSEKQGGNRDFILKYRLAGGKIETGLLLFEGKKENFFLLMIQPPKKVVTSRIPPREYIFIVDVSGSMHGFPLDISKKLLKDLIGSLRPTDTFNVILFAGGSHLMSEHSLSATPQNIAHAITIIDRERGGGGTRLLPALKRALCLPKTPGFSRSIVIATDGYVSVEEQAFDLIRNNLGQANMFTFGIGSSVNRHLIEGMARVGMGAPFVITTPEQAAEKADTFRKLIEAPVLTEIKVDFGKFKAFDVDPPSIPDVLADRPVIVFGKWHGRPRGIISIQGITGERAFSKKMEVSGITPLQTNSALRYLWARHRIALLSDYNTLNKQDERVHEVTRLGLTYNLLTAYTSFVAVDTQIRLQDGQSVTVKQPLPLPQGVSDDAVGGNRFFAGKSASSLAAAPSISGLQKLVMEERLERKKEDHLTGDLEPDLTAHDKNTIELGEVIVTGALTEKSVREVLKKHIPSFNICFRQGLENQPDVKGKVVFKMVIDSAGRVTKIHPDKGASKENRFKSCMRQELRTLHFPASKAGKERMVIITFVLK